MTGSKSLHKSFKAVFTPEHLILFLYFALYLIVGLSMVLKQPFGNPPDEYNRFLIPQYIARHGTLPNGYDEAIRIGGYGFSYGFQPILPYMLQGYTMRLAGLFTDSAEVLLCAARLVNLTLGLIMAFVLLKLAALWFTDKRLGYLFCFFVMFLPQSFFVHTYVNTDSCCMLSITLILYGLSRAFRDSFSRGSCCVLALGIILCALSYYNAYGYILSAILLFAACHLSRENGRLLFDWKPFMKKGCLIGGLVLLGIGWWFIRSFLLYDGDFLGLDTRNACGALYALPEFHPDTRVTYLSQGYTIWEMLKNSDFLNLSLLSLIGIYGPMTIVTSVWVYRFYKALLAAGLLACVALRGGRDWLAGKKGLSRFFHANMIFCMAMPALLSIYYSYSTDYQPQGRYLLPMLVPLFYYIVRGLEKAVLPVIKGISRLKIKISGSFLYTSLCVLLGSICVVCLLVTVYGYAFPYYELHPVAP